MGEVNRMKPHFTHPDSKRPVLRDRPTRPEVVGKFTLSKRITGDWHLERKFDRFPTDYGVNTHQERD